MAVDGPDTMFTCPRWFRTGYVVGADAQVAVHGAAAGSNDSSDVGRHEPLGLEVPGAPDLCMVIGDFPPPGLPAAFHSHSQAGPGPFGQLVTLELRESGHDSEHGPTHRPGGTKTAAIGAVINSDMKVSALAEVWLAEVEQSTWIPQTVALYRCNVANFIQPGIGGLALCEATTGQLDRFLKGVAARTPGQAKTTKTVLTQMFALAACHDAVQVNPVRDTRLPERRRVPVRALTVVAAQGLRAGLREYLAEPVKYGLGRPQDLADLVDVALGTGARVGELLALRWQDVDLGGLR